MHSKNSPSGKENAASNKSRTSRKSFGNLRQVLNTSGFLKTSDNGEIFGLNDKFTDYIDYVRSIEASNELLKNEKQSIIDSFEHEIQNIKSTYGNEIDTLRKALDDVSTAKSKLTYECESLIDEKSSLSSNLKNKSNSLIVLQKEYSELQENLNLYRKKVDSYESLKQSHVDVVKENKANLKSLKIEVGRRVELENRIVTLSEEIEFYKKLNNNAKNNFDRTVNVQNNVVGNVEQKMEELEDYKEQLTEEFEHYKEQLNQTYEEKFENLSIINEKSSSKCNSLYNEMKILKRTIEEMNNAIFEKDNQILLLNKRIASCNELLNKTNIDHENYVKDIIEDNNNLKKSLESKINEISEVVNERIVMEKELYMFRSLLEGEQSRCNISDVVSPKKRRKGNDDSINESNYDISAWANDRVKMYVDDKYDGSHVYLMNDTDADVNINEWKIEIIAEEQNYVYCFPGRVIKSKDIITVWKQDSEVEEDDNNVVMNVQLPLVDFMTCKLTNDMDEIEASFDLKKLQNKRKMLKANVKSAQKDGCMIM